MKVCVVSLNIVSFYNRSTESQYGGAEVQAAVLADAFADAGAEVSLVVKDLDDGVTLPHPAHNAFHSGAGIPGTRFFYPRVPGIFNALDRADADVYFQHCAGLVTGITALHCKRRGKRFVYFAGSDTDFSFRDARIGSLRDKIFFFWGLKNAAAIVAQNERQEQLCREHVGRESTVIPTAVALLPAGTEDKDGSVVWVGALREVKGPLGFVRLAAALPDCKFVMIGGGIASEVEHEREVREAAAGVSNLTLTGRVSRDDVDGYMRRAALLVNTSRVEGFPNAFLESWQHSTPVVSFVDVDGLIAGEGVGAVCADPGDMVSTIKRLLDDDNRRYIMGARARRLIEERYGAPALAKRYMELFNELVSA